MRWGAHKEHQGEAEKPRTAKAKEGTEQEHRLEPKNKRQPTSNKKESEERKKDRVRSANNDDGKTKEKKNEANKVNKARSGEKNNNQPDCNGGDLPCDGRQPLKAAANPPNPPSSSFEVAEVVKNRKVSFGESVGARK
jgi:hypothetical protein